MTYSHLRADCRYTGISSGLNASYWVRESLYLYLFLSFINYAILCLWLALIYFLWCLWLGFGQNDKDQVEETCCPEYTVGIPRLAYRYTLHSFPVKCCCVHWQASATEHRHCQLSEVNAKLLLRLLPPPQLSQLLSVTYPAVEHYYP